MDLAVEVHRATRLMPVREQFELGRELRRSSTSVPSNIAEGFSRHSRKVYRAQVSIALGSNGELETQLELSRRLELLDEPVVGGLIDRCGTVARLSQGLWRALA